MGCREGWLSDVMQDFLNYAILKVGWFSVFSFVFEFERIKKQLNTLFSKTCIALEQCISIVRCTAVDCEIL